MKKLLTATFLLLALLAAPAPLIVEDAAACQGQECPVSVEKCSRFGYHVWVLGEDYGFCLLGPVP